MASEQTLDSPSPQPLREAPPKIEGAPVAHLQQTGLFYALARHPRFRLLWIAGVVTQLGQWFQTVALGWLALSLTNSPAFVGQVGFATGVPMLLLSFPAGALLDRVDRRLALIGCQVGGAALASGIALLDWRGLTAPWHLIVAALISGALLALSQTATQTLVPALVPREALPNALALSSAGNSSTRIIGPSLAGAALGAIGIAGCFLTQAIALVAAALLTAGLRLDANARAGATLGGGILDGIQVIRRDRVLMGLLLLGCAPALLAYPYIQLLPVFARDVLHLDARGLGLLLAMGGIGALSGALAIARFGNTPHKGRIALIAGIVYGFVLTGFALSPTIVLTAPLLIVAGFLGSVFYSLNTILVQFHTREALRGRVMGALTLSFGLAPVGSLLLGDLAQRLGAPLAITAGSLGSSVLLVAIALRYRIITRL